MLMLITVLFLGFVIGAVTIIGIEILSFLFIIRKLNRKTQQENIKITESESCGRGDGFDFSYPNKQGFVWVLEKEKVPKASLAEKGPRQKNPKKEIFEVSPARKYAKIKDKLLIFIEKDRSHTEISLRDCTITAVSATNLSSRKWAKRYPIKVEGKSLEETNGSNSFYMYLETSWEKESWCKALRLASCTNSEKLGWFFKLHSDFHDYLTSLNIEYPTFLKPSTSFNLDIIDKSTKIDGSSKVRHFLKKLARKASKSSVEHKPNWAATSSREEKKISEKSGSMQKCYITGSSGRLAQSEKAPKNVLQENTVSSLSPAFTRLSSASQLPENSDADSVDKAASDEGTLCWNLLISRLFFDARSNAEMRSSIQARIQRTLSDMRSPSYIGQVTCTSVDPGNLPPYIHGIRVLPSDMKEIVAMEIDFEYRGGAVLDIETRLEVRELDLPGSVDTNSDSGSVGEVRENLIQDFEHLGEQLNLTQPVNDTEEKGDGNLKIDEIKSSKSQASSNVSRWKYIINSVAKQVSQVPLSWAIRVATLRGTLRVHIKPPPSDLLWFGFTTMPDIDFRLESSIGDHKITSGHIALFLISRFKAAIRETMVLPNFESLCLPWMSAEKDDWVPQKAAPFIWINQEEAFSELTTEPDGSYSHPNEETHVHDTSIEAHSVSTQKEKDAKKVESVQQCQAESSDESLSSGGPLNDAAVNKNPSQELRTPLLSNDGLPQEVKRGEQSLNRELSWPPQSPLSVEEQSQIGDGDEAKLGKIGSRRARMFGLGKKMGEKLEEKRRNIEERGRHIVEKMRGP